ncbi:MAG: hypothetical protein HQK51_05035 [Oligoflexia bacterium]|nr:hypothetical protein [Oligoflexia bacterium]
MNIKHLKRILQLFLFLSISISSLTLSGCLETKKSGKTKISSAEESSSTPTTEATATANSTSDNLYWHTHLKVGPSLAINSNINTVVSLRGTLINEFLNNDSNYQNQYCIVSTFKTSLGTNSASANSTINNVNNLKQLRARMIPVSIPSITSLSKNRGFSIDFANEQTNAVSCAGTVDNISSFSSKVVYSAAKVCSNCSLSIRSETNGVKLYTTNNNLIDDSTLLKKIDPSSLTLQINSPNANDMMDPSGQCTSKECDTKGFDCCMNGQCINDGMIRPEATAHANYNQAKMEVDSNSNNFIFWPELYYVCPGKILPNPIATTTTEPIKDAGTRLDYLTELYYCIMAGENQDYNYCQSTFDQNSYETAKNFLWTMCACAAVGTPAPQDPASVCRQYGMNVFDSNHDMITAEPTPNTLYGQLLVIDNRIATTMPYIRGSKINQFLTIGTNMQKKYCLVFNYNPADVGVLYKQLRVTADPIIKDNFITKLPERMLKVNLYETMKNKNYCRGSALDENNTPVPNISAQETYIASSTCNFACTSASTSIYYATTAAGISYNPSTQVSNSDLDISSLQLKITQDTTDLINVVGDLYWFFKKDDTIANATCKYYPDEFPTPFQQLATVVNAKMAPHRFFKALDGSAVNDILKIFGTPDSDDASSTPIVEGIPFKYDNSVRKTDPVNIEFNMNAILGQFKLDQTGAMPALTINVVNGETYMIAAISGNHSPCPSCAKDSWYTGFTAYPNSEYGTGLQAIGYTTYRDINAGNNTSGNYEDTIWGRACWIPPTMIPFSHRDLVDLDKNELKSVQTQRAARLTTQATYFMNGYQRDWYGFNKGALIGSFNGVNWFAVGKGRTVTATSTKLFLAFNEPFSDLADKSEHIIQITTGCNGDYCNTIYDYDAGVASLISPLQNEAANCQRFHYCETDSDCITNLGWEYVCANISNLRTYWPAFDKNANEIIIDKTKVAAKKFHKAVIFGNLSPLGGTNRKRCVYRGMGALCAANYSKITNFQERKLFTCAPNFYCEKLDGGNNFNKQIIREANNLDNIKYGKEANVLGRPAKYVNSSAEINTVAKANIKENANIQNPEEINTLALAGICRPGKYLTLRGGGEPVYSHQHKDSTNRTDFISQIGSCDSSIIAGPNVAIRKIHGCPLINDNTEDMKENSDSSTSTTDATLADNTFYGDYMHIEAPTYPILAANVSNYVRKLISQNSCGRESLYSGKSNFDSIEAGPLSSGSTVGAPTLAKDACLRRAGSVCHSELDCSPNKFHEAIAKGLPESRFGDTEAEKKYWEESLICSQEETITNYNSTDQTLRDRYLAYNLSKNRCCRETGSEFTMYTMGYYNPRDPASVQKLYNKLDTAPTAFAINNPAGIGRYSRYSVLEYLTTTEPGLGTPVPMQAKVVYTAAENIPAGATSNSLRPARYQWKTFNDTGKKTCCSSWIRLFADGTHEWRVSSTKLKINPENFRCLNYRTPLIYGKNYLPNVASEIENKSYEQEANLFCQDPSNYACAHYLLGNPDGTDKDNRSGFGKSKTTYLFPAQIRAFATNDERISVMTDATADGLNDVVVRVHSVNRAGYSSDFAPYVPNLVNSNSLTVTYPKSTTITRGSGWLNYTLQTDMGSEAMFAWESQTQLVIQIPAYINGGINIKDVYISRRALNSNPDNTYNFEGVKNAPDANAITATPLPIAGAASSGRLCGSPNRDPNHDYAFFQSENTNVAGHVTTTKQGWCYERETGWLFIKRNLCYTKYGIDGECVGGENIYYRSGPNVTDANGGMYSYSNAGIIIEFYPIGARRHCYRNCYDDDGYEKPNAWQTPANTYSNFSPGNDLYYLEKLSRLELLGIPQIYYEPLYCPSNAKKLVPGLYSLRTPAVFEDNYAPNIPESDNRTSFANDSFRLDIDYSTIKMYTPTAVGDYSNQDRRVVFQDSITLDPIFSPNRFICCNRLGSIVANQNNCCSQFSIVDPNNANQRICALPNKVDLYVYFNRFVSGEGIDESIDKSARLVDSDFDQQTGYPLPGDEVRKKIVALGTLYCQSQQVFTGAAFGAFGNRPIPGYEYPPPQTNPIDPYGILYLTSDLEILQNPATGDPEGNHGYVRFTDGRRWNNHLYCGTAR